MKGYWNRAEPDEHLLDGRWLRTGDAARVDQEGFVTIVGRLADGYTSDGRLVHPGDIETVFRDHPDVRDVAVIGVPDEAAGQVGAAFVELSQDADGDAILAWAADRLEPWLVPRSITVVERLPRNPAGKILRHELGPQGQPQRRS